MDEFKGVEDCRWVVNRQKVYDETREVFYQPILCILEAEHPGDHQSNIGDRWDDTWGTDLTGYQDMVGWWETRRDVRHPPTKGDSVEVVLEELDHHLLAQTRAQTTELHKGIEKIKGDENLHNKLWKIAVFDLPEESGKAHQQKQNMTNFYGRSPEIDGLVFSVARSIDGAKEYLGVQYVPELIREGAWDEFQDEKQEKAVAAKLRKEQREQEKKLEEELKALEKQNA